MTALYEKHFQQQYRRIQTIPGVKEGATTAIIAETGVDMKPSNDVSNGRYRRRKITHGKYLRQILIEAA